MVKKDQFQRLSTTLKTITEEAYTLLTAPPPSTAAPMKDETEYEVEGEVLVRGPAPGTIPPLPPAPPSTISEVSLSAIYKYICIYATSHELERAESGTPPRCPPSRGTRMGGHGRSGGQIQIRMHILFYSGVRSS